MNQDRKYPIVILPRILPRNFIDVCLEILIVLFQISVLCLLTAPLAGFFSGYSYNMVTFGIVYGFQRLFAVLNLKVVAEGIHFERLFGSPKFLPWHRISSIEVAPRRELVIRGLIWLYGPFFISPHYRITWDTGFCYYPPAKIKDFEQYVIAKLRDENLGA